MSNWALPSSFMFNYMPCHHSHWCLCATAYLLVFIGYILFESKTRNVCLCPVCLQANYYHERRTLWRRRKRRVLWEIKFCKIDRYWISRTWCFPSIANRASSYVIWYVAGMVDGVKTNIHKLLGHYFSYHKTSLKNEQYQHVRRIESPKYRMSRCKERYRQVR